MEIHKRGKFTDNPHSAEHARELVYRAERWRADNPAAWHYMASLAQAEAAAQRHFSIAWLINAVRRKDFSTSTGERFKINNSYAPVFSRMLIEAYPEVRTYIEVRTSITDGVR
ncbi:MAG: hypothetical protein RR319_07395 [Bacteroides sp.]